MSKLNIIILLTTEAELFQPGLSAIVDSRQYPSVHNLHSHICPMRNSNPLPQGKCHNIPEIQ